MQHSIFFSEKECKKTIGYICKKLKSDNSSLATFASIADLVSKIIK